jgi:uncharacterized RDD family membrane protein YckC
MGRARGAGVKAARSTESEGILFRRWLGCWIDFIVAAVLAAVSIAPFAGGGASDRYALAWFALMLTLVLGYFTLAEGLTGRTLGKLITGTIVVDASGRPPGVPRALVRSLFRLIEVNPFLLGGVPAGISAALTQSRQRLGDLAAGTYVVRVATLEKMARTPDIAKVFD